MKQQFEQHIKYFIDKIKKNENFALARYADGEKLVLDRRNVNERETIDGWRYENNHIFTNDLLNSTKHREKNYFYGISCSCCDLQGELYYRKLFDNHNITFSNIFVNSNHENFIDFISTIQREVVLIANKECMKSDYPFKIIKKIPIENNCIFWYENNKNMITEVLEKIAKNYNNKLFLISAGPLSEIIIDNLFSKNINNTYIDVGSSIDIFTHKNNTRPYQIKGSSDNKKICYFNDESNKGELSC